MKTQLPRAVLLKSTISGLSLRRKRSHSFHLVSIGHMLLYRKRIGNGCRIRNQNDDMLRGNGSETFSGMKRKRDDSV